MKNYTFPSQYKASNQLAIAKGEEGMTMVIALLMGTVLVAGSTGLMVRQIMARKLGASESYQQMAESAALNGLNRIISDINRDDRGNYTGFLLSLNNSDGQWGWAAPNSDDFELVELAHQSTNTPRHTQHKQEQKHQPYRLATAMCVMTEEAMMWTLPTDCVATTQQPQQAMEKEPFISKGSSAVETRSWHELYCVARSM